MLKIEVTSQVTVKHVARKADGVMFEIPEQTCWVHLPGDAHPTKVLRGVGRGNEPLKEGTYTLDSSSFYVDRFGGLAIKAQFAVQPVSVAPAAQVGGTLGRKVA